MSNLDLVLSLAQLQSATRVMDAPPPPERAEKNIASLGAGAAMNLLSVGTQPGGARNQDIPRTKYGAALGTLFTVAAWRCTQFRARQMLALPWRIEDADTGDVLARSDEGYPTHRLAMAIRNYELQEGHNLFLQWQWFLSVYGENYIDLIMDEQTQIAGGLYILNPLYAEPIDPHGRIDGFMYYGDSKFVEYAPHEIAYNRYMNHLDRNRGYSPALAAIDEMNISHNWKRYFRAFYINYGMPALAVMPPEDDTWNDQDVALVKRALARVRGVTNAFKGMVMPSRATFEQFQQHDMKADIEIHEYITRIVHKAYGVNEALTGDTSGKTFKDGAEAMDYTMRLTVLPEADFMASHVTNRILPEFINPFQESANQRFVFDKSEWDRVSEDDQRRSSVAGAQFTSNIATLDEAREAVKLPPHPRYGDKLLIELEDEFGGQENPMELVARRPKPQPATDEGSQLPQAQTPPQSLNGRAKNYTPQRAIGEAFVSLMIGADQALIEAQRDLIKGLGDAFTPQIPERFHITLVYAERVAPVKLAEIVRDFKAEAVTVLTGELDIFGDNDERAVVLRVYPDQGLMDMQARLYELFTEAGAMLSGYSHPERYSPHITLGYLKRDVPVNYATEPYQLNLDTVTFARDDYEPVAFARAEKAVLSGLKSLPVLNDLEDFEWSLEDAQRELDAWKRYAKRVQKRGYKRDETEFTPKYLRGDIGDFITEGLSHARNREEQLTVFRSAEKWLHEKAIDTTRDQFEAEFDDVVRALFEGKIDRRAAGPRLRGIITRAQNQAYIDGLTDGGVTTESLSEVTDEDRQIIRDLRADQRGQITKLTSAVSQNEITLEQLKGKAAMWWRKTVNPFYTSGLRSADANGLYEVVGVDGDESCATCQYLKGRRHRLSTFARHNLIPPESSRLICGGFECQHGIEPARGKATRGGLAGTPTKHIVILDDDHVQHVHTRGHTHVT